MKKLEEEQRKMRERLSSRSAKQLKAARIKTPKAKEATEPKLLLQRIRDLESENAALRRELSVLRDQPRLQQGTRSMSDDERRHLFMKYSNVRRY